MKNIVNRALVAKKKQFQSKAVPRGTRTIWRYLSALFILFTFAIGNVWADALCSATLNGISANSNTTGIAQTGCTMKWNSVTYSGSDVVTIGSVSYYKFSGSSSYVQLVLSSGKFQAGDELTVTLCSNAGSGKTKSVQYSLHSDSGNKPEAQNVGSAAPTDVSYTLVAADIESDGSIKIFRGGNTNIRFGSFSVTRSSGSASTDPVSSVTVDGAASGYATIPVELTATPDETATAFKWFVDGVEQDGETTATFDFEPATPGTYSIVAKARNDYNAENEWIASTAHTYTASKLCGELIKIVQNGQSDGNVSGILTGTKDVKLSSGTSDYDEKTGRKIGSDNYWLGVTNLSKPLRAGDVATIFVTTASAKLQLFSDKGTTLIGEMESGVAQGENEIVLNSSATGKTAIYLYRTSTAGSAMNPFVHSLSVTRSCEASTDCSISNVTINSEAITPVGKVYSYEVAAASTLTEVEVAYSIHPLATATPATGFKVAVPSAGDPANTQTITVTAEDGTHSDTYTVSVSKATAASDVVTLDALAVTGYTLAPTFDAGTLAYTITKAYGAADPASNLVTYTKTEEAQSVNVAYDSENHKFTVTVKAEDNTTTQDYVITINEADAKRDLLEVMFSNGAKGAINASSKEIRVPYIGSDAPTYASSTFASWVEDGATAAMNEGKLKVTGVDNNYDEYTIIPVQLDATGVAVGEDITFEAVPAYIFAPYGWDSGKGVKMAKNYEQESNRRVSSGNSRMYIAVPAGVQTLQLTSGSAAKRNVIIKVNGETSSVTKMADSNEAIELAMNPAIVNFVYIENNSGSGGGDGGFIKMHLVPTPPTFSVTYMPNGGSGAEYILDSDASEVAAGTIFTAPASSIFTGWNTQADGNGVAYAAGDAVTENLTLHAQWQSYFTITYMDGETELDTEDVLEGDAPVGIADPVKAMNIFKGWTLAGSDEVIDVTALTTATTVYAKWEAIDACFYFSAKSVDASTSIAVDEEIDNANGGKVIAKTNNISYETLGVLVASSGSTYMKVELDYAMMEGTKISVKLAAGGTSTRGVNICYDANKDHKAVPMTWSATEAGEVKEFEYTLDSESALNGKKEFFIYRASNTYIQTVMVKDCAPQDYTVTYKDGETVLGTEQVFENEHPTADGINTHKKGYEFQGWAETVDGAVVDLDDITITAAKNLFAQYTVMDCSPKGVKFSMAVDGSKISANQYYPATTPAVGDLAVFATVTGGVAQAVNTSTGSTKNFEVKTTPEFKLGGNNSHMRILLDCPLAENDTIKFTKTERITLSFDSLKTKSENIAKTTSYYIVPAAYAGEDTIHIWYNSNGVSVNGVQVIRPEIYAVSFNLMGHGSAIAPVNVVKGAKIVAPTAPEDENFAFAGWYKENTLSNAWDFDNDVVAANTILYAKWLDMTDATLKSLKYGATDIVLEDGVYEYNVELPALSTSVPALTAETSNPNATKEIANATEFDAEGHATSTVVVTPEKEGAATQTYIVNFAKAAALPQVNVTGSTTWNFSAGGSTTLTNQTDVVLANVPGINNDANFNSQALLGSFNKMEGTYFQGSKLSFTTEVPGKLTITFRGTNNNARHLQVCVGDGEAVVADWNYQGSGESAQQEKTVFVPAGKVTLRAFEDETPNNARIYNMIFNATPDYERPVSNNIGTLSVEKNVPAGQYFGATFYQIAGRNATYPDKIDFDEVAPSEELKAGEPYIFQSTTGKIDLFYAEGAAVTEPVVVNGMHGVLVAGHLDITEDNMMDVYYISENKLRDCSNLLVDGLNLVANRAYIVMSEVDAVTSAPAPGRRRISIGGANVPAVTTGVDALNAAEAPVKMIINGQLFILRGEKMYDVQGQLVK